MNICWKTLKIYNRLRYYRWYGEIVIYSILFVSGNIVKAETSLLEENTKSIAIEDASCFTWAFGMAEAISDAYEYSTLEDFDRVFADLFSSCLDEEVGY